MTTESNHTNGFLNRPILNKDAKLTVDQVEDMIATGVNQEDLILYLHSEGLSIVDTMKIVRWAYGISLGEAKRIVTAHPVWSRLVSQMDIVHEKLLDAAEKEEQT